MVAFITGKLKTQHPILAKNMEIWFIAKMIIWGCFDILGKLASLSEVQDQI